MLYSFQSTLIILCVSWGMGFIPVWQVGRQQPLMDQGLEHWSPSPWLAAFPALVSLPPLVSLFIALICMAGEHHVAARFLCPLSQLSALGAFCWLWNLAVDCSVLGMPYFFMEIFYCKKPVVNSCLWACIFYFNARLVQFDLCFIGILKYWEMVVEKPNNLHLLLKLF